MNASSEGAPARVDARTMIPGSDVLLVTLDALRYDVAREALEAGETPCLARLVGRGGWEKRHAPGSFTYASHQAIFAGFFPSPAASSRRPRLFALAATRETTDGRTLVLDAPDIVTGLRGLGYRAICIGGVSFFNKRNPLGAVLPSLFDESHWSPAMGVTARDSTREQVALAASLCLEAAPDRPLFLFVNVSALHPPTHFYLAGSTRDSKATQRAALAYVDGELPPLLAALRERSQRRARPCLAIVCSDHGTAFGEDGYVGHRLAHPTVWNVPYLETVLAP